MSTEASSTTSAGSDSTVSPPTPAGSDSTVSPPTPAGSDSTVSPPTPAGPAPAARYDLENLIILKTGTATFKITSYDSEGKPTTASGIEFTGSMYEGETKKDEKKIEFTDNKDGTYTGTYSIAPEDAHDYTVSISYKNASGEEKWLTTNPWKEGPFTLPFLNIPFTTTYPDAGYKIPYVVPLPENPYASHVGFESIFYSNGDFSLSKPYVYNTSEKAEKGWYRCVRCHSGSGNNEKVLGKLVQLVGMKETGSCGHSSMNYPEAARHIPMMMYAGWGYWSQDFESLKMELAKDDSVVQYYMDEFGAYDGTAVAANSKYEGSGISAWTPGLKGDFTISFQNAQNKLANPPKSEIKLEITHVKSKTPIPFESKQENAVTVSYTPPTGLELGEIKVDMYWSGKLVSSKSIYAWGHFVADWKQPSDSSSSSSSDSSSSSSSSDYSWKPNQILSVEHSKFSYFGFDSATVDIDDKEKKLVITIDNPYLWVKESKSWLHLSWDKEEGKIGETISKDISTTLGLTYQSHEAKNIISEWAGFNGTKAATYDSEKGFVPFPEYLQGLKKITTWKSI